MQEGFSTRETWPFECLRCLLVWEEEYVVRHLTDSHGNDADVWFRAELLVQPPWSGARCPSCGDIAVKPFPRGYLIRHPELRGAPPPVAPGTPAGPGGSARLVPEARPSPGTPVTEPAAGPAPARSPLGARLRISVPMYAMIGLSLLLFAGLGLLEILRAAHHVH
ncbi:hypothetical protein [Sphaerisporangium perillae]|uniref:hypothetical protein n=1 Tax=Sphaerisporangium perillae TaxID=2935860 RepID=UPI00200BB540|nr:hypothetical protein [Sphaerisporangium perillae]